MTDRVRGCSLRQNKSTTMVDVVITGVSGRVQMAEALRGRRA